MKSWVYGSVRWKTDFRQEVDLFLKATEKHSMATKNRIEILCLCSDCKNGITWNEVTRIRSHFDRARFCNRLYSLDPSW